MNVTCTKAKKQRTLIEGKLNTQHEVIKQKFRRLQIPILKQHTISCHIVKGAVKAPAVDLFEAEHHQRYKEPLS